MSSEERIRIVFLIGHLGYGGTERQLYLLLTHLDLHRFEPMVFVFNPSPNASFAEKLMDVGVRVVELPSSCTGIVRRSLILLRALRKFRPSIVHSWTIHDNAYAGIVGRLAGVPVRWGSVRLSLAAASFKELSRAYRWLSIFSVQRHAVNAESLIAELKSAGFPEEKISFIPNCVAPAGVAEFARFGFEGRGIGRADPIVGIVANYRRTKNLTMFVRVMRKVVEHCPDAHGVMVGHPVAGDPGVWQEVEREIVDCGLAGRIHMIGFRDDAPTLVGLFSVFLLTSTAEGTPNVLLEAMAIGIPIVAPAIDGIPGLIRAGNTGLLFPPGDEEAAASHVLQFLGDRELASNMGLAAQMKVQAGYQCEEMAARFEETYTRVNGLAPND